MAASNVDLWWDLVETPAGWLRVEGDATRITGLGFPMEDRNSAEWTAGAEANGLARGGPEPLLAIVRSYMQEYFNGRSPKTVIPLSLEGQTRFTRRVLEETAAIPWGQVVSYGELAQRVGVPRGARAVGQALGRNPIPIVIPCHRVLTSTRSIGGFGGGLGMKRKLLALEGIDC